MNTLSTRPSNLPSEQQGAVLIIVLLFLVLITLVGVMSVRNSSTDLKLATSDQINTVLLQSSDNVNSNIEQSINNYAYNADSITNKKSNPIYLRYENMVVNANGLFGRYTANADPNNPVVDVTDFCYRPRTKFYNSQKASVLPESVTKTKAVAFCDPSNKVDYNSDRAIVMTQVKVTNVGEEEFKKEGNFSGLSRGVGSNEQSSMKFKFQTLSTSGLPAYGNKTATVIKNCFKATDVQKCLIENDVASKAVAEQVEVEQKNFRGICTYYGTTSNPAADTTICSDTNGGNPVEGGGDGDDDSGAEGGDSAGGGDGSGDAGNGESG